MSNATRKTFSYSSRVEFKLFSRHHVAGITQTAVKPSSYQGYTYFFYLLDCLRDFASIRSVGNASEIMFDHNVDVFLRMKIFGDNKVAFKKFYE